MFIIIIIGLYLSIILPAAAAEPDCIKSHYRYMSKVYINFSIAGPVSVSALIGENAVFYCNGSGAIIQWIVDGVYATHSNITARGIAIHTETLSGNTLQSTLTVPATLENNGTTVQCIVFPSEVTSEKATLTVLPGKMNMYTSVIYERVT